MPGWQWASGTCKQDITVKFMQDAHLRYDQSSSIWPKMSGGCESQPHPDFLMMVIRALSNPHCSKVTTGLGASKPDTLIPSCALMLAIYVGAAHSSSER